MSTVVLFIARASGSVAGVRIKEDSLHSSLDYTESRYASQYADYDADLCERLVLAGHHSNHPLRPRGLAIQTMNAFLEKARTLKSPARLVLNGFDGLTTHMGSFVKYFEQHSDVSITMTVFAGEPRTFIDANLHSVVGLVTGDIDDDDEEDDSLKSAREMVRKITLIGASKRLLSETFQELHTESHLRNTPSEMLAGVRLHGCSKCDKSFKTKHERHVHESRCGPAKYKCSKCDRRFKRSYSMVEHEKVCGDQKAPPAKRVKRAAEDPKEQPRVDRTAHVRAYDEYEVRPAGLPPYNDAVVSGERFCRWTGCEDSHKFARFTHLETHYKAVHAVHSLGRLEIDGPRKNREEKMKVALYLEELAMAAHKYEPSSLA